MQVYYEVGAGRESKDNFWELVLSCHAGPGDQTQVIRLVGPLPAGPPLWVSYTVKENTLTSIKEMSHTGSPRPGLAVNLCAMI